MSSVIAQGHSAIDAIGVGLRSGVQVQDLGYLMWGLDKGFERKRKEIKLTLFLVLGTCVSGSMFRVWGSVGGFCL